VVRVIIAGGRERPYGYVYGYTIKQMRDYVTIAMREAGYWAAYPSPEGDVEATISEVVSGCASGIDKLGEDWAVNNYVPIKRFPADWQRYGKSAGFIRNVQMAEYAGALVAIWDGRSRGTWNMIQEANRRDLRVYVYGVE
jgi:hypothetical protein